MATAPTNSPVLRVAHVVLQLETGGMEKLLVEFARHADRSRFDLRFISLTGRGTLSDEIESCNWPLKSMNEPPGLRPGMVLRLARLFREWDVDIVHTHNTKPLLYAGPAARWVRVRSVVHTSHGQRYGSSWPHTMMFVAACRTVDRVVCVSHNSAVLRHDEGIPQSKVSTIWNGIDVSRFASHGPKADGPAVLVARLSPEKDVESLLRAAAIIVRNDPSFQLEIAGDGASAALLRQLAADLHIAQHVRFLGDVRDIPSLLQRASLFVLPSLTEGVSLSLLEAMASGLPVVATRVGGNVEVVVHEQTGLLVPAKDPAELAGVMMRLRNNPELGRQMGLAGRKRVEEHFDVKMTVRNYEAMYQDLASRGSERSQHSLAASTS